jgi:hypothetical protein
MTLISFPRVMSWADAATQAQQFQLMGDVAAGVPVFTARIPWGPPFPAHLAHSLLEAIGLTRCTAEPGPKPPMNRRAKS